MELLEQQPVSEADNQHPQHLSQRPRDTEFLWGSSSSRNGDAVRATEASVENDHQSEGTAEGFLTLPETISSDVSDGTFYTVPEQPLLVVAQGEMLKVLHQLAKQTIDLSSIDAREIKRVLVRSRADISELTGETLRHMIGYVADLDGGRNTLSDYSHPDKLLPEQLGMPSDADIMEWEEALIRQDIDLYSMAPSAVARVMADGFPFLAEMEYRTLIKNVSERYKLHHPGIDQRRSSTGELEASPELLTEPSDIDVVGTRM